PRHPGRRDHRLRRGVAARESQPAHLPPGEHAGRGWRRVLRSHPGTVHEHRGAGHPRRSIRALARGQPEPDRVVVRPGALAAEPWGVVIPDPPDRALADRGARVLVPGAGFRAGHAVLELPAQPHRLLAHDGSAGSPAMRATVENCSSRLPGHFAERCRVMTSAVKFIPMAVLAVALFRAPASAAPSATPVGAGDILQVTFFAGGEKQEDFTATVAVTGTITCPLLGDAKVAGLTTDEIAK